MSAVLAYVAAALVAVWGLAHAVPTRQVVAGFGPISADKVCPVLMAVAAALLLAATAV